MAPIASFSGLSSGVQWSDMIDQIMSIETTRRLTPVANRIKLQEQRKSAWGDYNSLVAKLRDASKAFADGAAFGAFKTSATNSAVSGRALISASAGETAAPGSYSVEVLSLARAEKVGSAGVADPAADLELAGTFHVNGRAVTLAGGDSLAALRDKINAANTGTHASGVTATILSTSATSHRLILTADGTGSRGVELVDSDTGVLQSAALGILSGSTTNNSSTVESGWTDSIRYSSRTEVLKDVLGVSPPPAVSNILVGGVQVQIDFNNDTLDSVLAKIQTADPAAKMREEVVNGKTMYRLSTSATVAADPSSPESQRNLELLGFSRRSAASQISAGADARLQIDGYDLVRRTNRVSDAIEGVTLDLLATDAASRTTSVTGTDLSIGTVPTGIDSGTYAVEIAASVAKTATTSGPTLAVSSPVPAGAANGTYTVDITAPATQARADGAGFDGAYNQASVFSPDRITITDGAGRSATVNLSNNQNVDTIVINLRNAFTANGVAMNAVNHGGQLQLISTAAAGSSSTFSVGSSGSSVQSNLGIANGTYVGTDLRGTIGGQAATGSGNTLTADAGTTVAGLSVTYSGASTGAVGSVTIADSTTVTGGTIDGVTVDWDVATRTLRGRTGTRFAGIELGYTGTAASGKVGDLVIGGDISVELTISRDTEATEKKVQELVDRFNEIASFVKQQRDGKGPLGTDGSLRSMFSSLREVLFTQVSGLSATNPYSLLSLAGVEFTREGTLKLDGDALKDALAKGPADVKELFSGVGRMMKDAAAALADPVSGSIKLHQEAISSSISTLEVRELNVEGRLERQRAALVKQYTAMEEAMSRLQSQGSWLTSQLAGLSSSQR